MPDGIQQLTHDHIALNHQVVATASLVRGFESHGVGVGSALLTTLAELREQLFTHFAREEEGLFPFVAEAVPEIAERVHAMTIAHDTICGALVRTFHLAKSDASLTTIAAVFERFVEAYAAHASSETALLDELGARLDDQQRTRLASLVDGL